MKETCERSNLLNVIPGDAQHRTWNLEIPGSPFGRPGMTAETTHSARLAAFSNFLNTRSRFNFDR